MKKKRKNLGSWIVFIAVTILITIFSYKEVNTGNIADNLMFWFVFESCFVFVFIIWFFVKSLITPKDIELDYKNIPEEFKRILNVMEDRNLLDYEALRIKILILSSIKAVATWGLVISLLIIFGSDGYLEGDTIKTLFIIALISGGALFAVKGVLNRDRNEYIYMYKKEVIPTLLNEMNPNFKYVPIDLEKQKEYEELYDRSSFTSNLDSIYTEDYIEGYAVADTYMKLAEVKALKVDSSDEEYTEFHGIFAHFDSINYKDYKEITISGRTRELIPEVDTHNPEFYKHYKIFSSNTEKVQTMINKGLCDELLVIHNKYGCLFDITIRQGEVYIRINVGETFDPDIKDSSKGVRPLYEHYTKFKMLFDIFYTIRSYLD